MAPIRVALIGLSSSARTSWVAHCHLPLSPPAKSYYGIVALLNSSVASAEAARKHFSLPSDVRTYGDPNDLALDPDVDFVVCCTRADTHSLTTEPSLRARKSDNIEWPIGVSPIVLKLRAIFVPTVISYLETRSFVFHKPEHWGNPITIAFGHTIDYMHEVLGEFASFKSLMQIQRPVVAVLGKNGTRIKKIESDVPDFLAVHRKLAKGKDWPRLHDTVARMKEIDEVFKWYDAQDA
ncbi:hypothetical protein F4813DRAFT_386846 [Daldinia decipiens]|uniref:uncharacterized protein n=1 Tax=Daldinia decipiens TaxID=326647 RepID=UPI0020C1BA9A|nr:uncharacterized protein F4813DRAFT_386846 [Daldinia decipiens]KAI1660652.1 hypothetical protein F4813DRAFT_386846 [Daldinia decipiens]